MQLHKNECTHNKIKKSSLIAYKYPTGIDKNTFAYTKAPTLKRIYPILIYTYISYMYYVHTHQSYYNLERILNNKKLEKVSALQERAGVRVCVHRN